MKKLAFILSLMFIVLALTGANADVVYNLKLSTSAITLSPGDSRTITWSVEPVNLVQHSVTWSSDNPYVASVDSRGKISAHAAGFTYIRATLETGVTRRVSVNVSGNAVTKLELSRQSAQMEIGESIALTYEINQDADDKRVKWSSDDTKVAKVDSNGTVTAVGGGVATITLLCVNGMTATCVIYVPSDVMSVSMSESDIEIGVGAQFALTASVNPVNARNRTLSWVSSDETVASVDSNGVVTGVGAGECKIGARSENGKYGVTNVSVVIMPESITISPANVYLSKSNRQASLEIGISPVEAASSQITWTSSDETIVSVDNGILTAKGYGSVIISAEAANGISANAYVYVGETPESVRLNMGTYLLPMDGEGAEVYAVFSPLDSVSRGYMLTIEDESIAVIDENDVLHAVSPGITHILLKSEEGLTCSSEIRVYEDIKQLIPASSDVILKQYEFYELTLYSETGRAFTGQLAYTIEDESICAYADGRLYGKNPGSTIITLSNPGTSAMCKINVNVRANSEVPTRVVALTFDNGPDEYTADILHVLDKYGVKATFFLLGKNIERHPDTSALLKDSPHELGNHTYDNSSIASGSIADTANAIEKTDKAAAKYIGAQLTVLRAPDALLPKSVLSSFLDTRRFIGRGYDLEDASGRLSAQEICDSALAKVYNTCVFTLHDCGSCTAEALDMLIPALLEKGYRFMTISELIDYTGFDSGIFSTVP